MDFTVSLLNTHTHMHARAHVGTHAHTHTTKKAEKSMRELEVEKLLAHVLFHDLCPLLSEICLEAH